MAFNLPLAGAPKQSNSASFANPLYGPAYARQAVGQAVANVGDTMGIPRIGIAQFIAGRPVGKTQGVSYAAENTGLTGTNGQPFSVNGSFTPVVQQPQQQSTGGGGGYGGGVQGRDPHINPSTGVWDDNYFAANNQPSDASQIDSLYNEINPLLDQQEQSLRGGQQDFYDSYTKQYDAQLPLLANAQDQGLQDVNSQQGAVHQDEANAITAARNLYNELTQGSRQRFGGSSSSGEFSNAILGREFQRNVGQVQNTAGQNTQKLLDKATQIKNTYQTQVQSLEQQKQSALLQAKDAFNQKLNDISNSRIQLGENKATAKLQALRDLRANVNTIQNAIMQQHMNLQAQQQSADLNLRNAIAAQSGVNNQQVDLGTHGPATYSQFGGGTQSTDNYTPQGQLLAGGRKPNPWGY